MSAIKGFRVYQLDLAAGQEITLDATGDFFRVMASDRAFGIAIEDGMVFAVEAGIGFKMEGEAFSKLRVVETLGLGVTLSIAIGYGVIDDARLVIAGSLPTRPTSANGLASVADVSVPATTTALVAAANADRVEIIVQNLGGTEMRIGDSAVTAGRGVKLDGGGTLTLTTSAAVYAYNAAGAAVDVSVLETERV
ncbi:hypothetical protein [Oceanibaculum indicum]|uniref:Uncharacterized protein n=1 Tax=Oceanibaculum indicum TaxID=526216 RepID=A0A420WQ38_9PROT|nr:hypothetical protein [Oceanibaculum indicum]RKQ73109.1 hypothetical protein BCL74_0882 [Oceanibaculum indicum]